MSDIIVTTPKSEIGNAAKEAAECIANGGGWYFRRVFTKPRINRGERVWYVEDGYIRGYAIVSEIIDTSTPEGRTKLKGMGLEVIPECDVTGRRYGHGNYIFMRAESWKWINPVAKQGFQGWQYFNANTYIGVPSSQTWAVGGWKDPKPKVIKRAV